MEAVVDFEGFHLAPRRFIVKELAYCDIRDPAVYECWSFQPPHAFERLHRKKQLTYSWISRNLHGYRWEDGELPYAKLREIFLSIFNKYSKIYVKGLEKTKFVEYLSGKTCFNLDDANCPKISDLSFSCGFHHASQYRCAQTKAVAYANFVYKSTSGDGAGHLTAECQSVQWVIWTSWKF